MPRRRAPELSGRAWIGTAGQNLTLASLRGKAVILDFWTFCCINCLHVLDELRPLEAKYPDTLVVLAIHSPKFTHETDPAALRDAVSRYDIRHPVLDDPTLATWKAYGARAWPTLVLIDPAGRIATTMAGEGHGPALDAIVGEEIAHARRTGTLRPGPSPYIPPAPSADVLAFPSKAIPLDDGVPHLLVADAGHHGLAEVTLDGGLVRRIGSGERGLADGPPGEARFSEPSGLTRLPGEVARQVGYDIVVADTVNHALRGVRLPDGLVTTVAGTGEPWTPAKRAPWFVPGLAADAGPREISLSSPWDVVWDAGRGAVIVAMAGIHQLWAFDPVTGRIGPIAGTRSEGLADGPADAAWLAQPSGLAVVGEEVWFVDSETSALRVLERGRGGGGDRVRTAVGEGLFDFGFADGPGRGALMQHPLGIAAAPGGGALLIADTYNGAVRRYDLGSGLLTTVAAGLGEPSDVVVVPGGGGEPRLFVVESTAHRIVEVGAGESIHLTPVREATSRPMTQLTEGVVRLSVPFSPAPGQKLDSRFGPSVELTVSATPGDLLAVGAGTTQELERSLVLTAGEGVLHVTAKAAACDIDSPNPACHMVSQDWGVPVRVARRDGIVHDPGDQEIELPLRG
jgi:thiol-disulfide isomerase/thioredoxin